MSAGNQTFAPTNGVDGDVYIPGAANTKTRIAGIASWQLKGDVKTTRVRHFGAPVDANGVARPRVLRGDGENTVSIKGVFNLSLVNGTEIVGGAGTAILDGLYVTLDLIASKAPGSPVLGYPAVSGYIKSATKGQEFGEKLMEFTCEIEVDGPVSPFGQITVA